MGSGSGPACSRHGHLREVRNAAARVTSTCQRGRRVVRLMARVAGSSTGMPHIPLVEPDDASIEVKAVYDEFYQRMCFPAPPNFIKTQGHSAAAARGTWEAVRNVLVMGEIPRWTKEIIFVAISSDRQCRYCEAAHIACCRMLGVSPRTLLDLARDVDSLSDTKGRVMVHFALKCSRNPQPLTSEDYGALHQQGLSQSQIMELIAMAAFAVYANIIADATAMEADKMFSGI